MYAVRLFVFTLPEIVWEASLGIYLIVKGFKPAAIAGYIPPAELPAEATAA